VIRIQNVGKTYRAQDGEFHALHDIDLTVAKGEVFGIIGHSGAGKSTLLRLINLLERPTVGHILIEGEDIGRLDEEQLRRLRHRVGIIFQHFNLLNSRTVEENVRFPLRVAGTMGRAEQKRRVAEVLELVGIADQANKYPRHLSGGQRQRVGIARALANRPHVLLCDEATSALDPQTTQSILRLLLEINQRLGLTIVLITHSMDVIRAVADRVAVLDQGRIVESGTVLEVFLNPHHAVTRALLAESGFESDSALGVAGGQGGQGGHVLRLTYQGAAAGLPLLTRLSRESGLDFSILQGSVGRLKDMPYGQLTVELEGLDEERFGRLLSMFAAHEVRCEVLR
jgi:D-methionine transport system ATP-binding protein